MDMYLQSRLRDKLCRLECSPCAFDIYWCPEDSYLEALVSCALLVPGRILQAIDMQVHSAPELLSKHRLAILSRVDSTTYITFTALYR